MFLTWREVLGGCQKRRLCDVGWEKAGLAMRKTAGAFNSWPCPGIICCMSKVARREAQQGKLLLSLGDLIVGLGCGDRLDGTFKDGGRLELAPDGCAAS